MISSLFDGSFHDSGHLIGLVPAPALVDAQALCSCQGGHRHVPGWGPLWLAANTFWGVLNITELPLLEFLQGVLQAASGATPTLVQHTSSCVMLHPYSLRLGPATIGGPMRGHSWSCGIPCNFSCEDGPLMEISTHHPKATHRPEAALVPAISKVSWMKCHFLPPTSSDWGPLWLAADTFWGVLNIIELPLLEFLQDVLQATSGATPTLVQHTSSSVMLHPYALRLGPATISGPMRGHSWSCGIPCRLFM